MKHAESMREVSEEFALKRTRSLLIRDLIERGIADSSWADWIINGEEIDDLAIRVRWLEDLWQKRSDRFREIDRTTTIGLSMSKEELACLIVINRALIFLTDLMLSQKP